MRLLPILALATGLLAQPCDHRLRAEQLKAQFGRPCEEAVVDVTQAKTACGTIYPAPERQECLAVVAGATRFVRVRYCTGGDNASNCAAPACRMVGDYWFADDTCPVATFGPPRPGALAR